MRPSNDALLPIYVEEPTVDDTIKMLMGLRDRYEAHHKVRYADEALVAAARLADRYVTDRRLPDKAIDLMDEAAAKLRVALYSMPPDLKAMKTEIDKMQAEEEQAGLNVIMNAPPRRNRNACASKRNITRSAINGNPNTSSTRWWMWMTSPVVNQWTGIPLTQMMESESEKLLNMEAVCMSASSARRRPSMPSPMRSAVHARA
jgi:ATP-dependent Clp protease ATP-binding subunit ClpC